MFALVAGAAPVSAPDAEEAEAEAADAAEAAADAAVIPSSSAAAAAAAAAARTGKRSRHYDSSYYAPRPQRLKSQRNQLDMEGMVHPTPRLNPRFGTPIILIWGANCRPWPPVCCKMLTLVKAHPLLSSTKRPSPV